MEESEHKFHMWFTPGCPECIAKQEADDEEFRRMLASPEGAEFYKRFWEHVGNAAEQGMGLALDAKQTRALYAAYQRGQAGEGMALAAPSPPVLPPKL